MSANIRKSQAFRLLDTIRDDIRNGAPGAWLEPDEVPRWVAELNEGSKETVATMRTVLIDALVDMKSETGDRLDKLLIAMMDDIRLDKVVELRDLLRSELTDYCIDQANEMVEQ